MSGWVVVGQKPANKKPRKKPIAKRTPLPLPDTASLTQVLIYRHLVKIYPQQVTCEDLFEQLLRDGNVDNVKLDLIWSAIDSEPLNEIVTRNGNRYNVKAE